MIHQTDHQESRRHLLVLFFVFVLVVVLVVVGIDFDGLELSIPFFRFY